MKDRKWVVLDFDHRLLFEGAEAEEDAFVWLKTEDIDEVFAAVCVMFGVPERTRQFQFSPSLRYNLQQVPDYVDLAFVKDFEATHLVIVTLDKPGKRLTFRIHRISGDECPFQSVPPSPTRDPEPLFKCL